MISAPILRPPQRRTTITFLLFTTLLLLIGEITHDDGVTKTWKMISYASAFTFHVRKSVTASRTIRTMTECPLRLCGTMDGKGDRHSLIVGRPSHRSFRTKPTFHLSASPLSSSDETPPPSDSSKKEKQETNKPGKMKRKGRIQVNPNDDEIDLDALTAAFDKMAEAEGFDASTAFYADDDSFEDDFDSAEMAGTKGTEQPGIDVDGDLNLDDFLDGDDDGEDDDEFLDFGANDEPAVGNDMDARILAAQRDLSQPNAPPSRRSRPRTVTPSDMSSLGFRTNSPTQYGAPPDGGPSQPAGDQCRLVDDALVCSACGADFQGKDELKPGYLPQEKYGLQVKRGRMEEAVELQEKAERLEEGDGEWSTEDEVEWLLKSGPADGDGKIDLAALAEELGLDPSPYLPNDTNNSVGEDTPPPKKPICKRCHTLQHSSTLPTPLRPSPTTTEPTLTQAHFRSLLLPLSSTPCVLIALVDLFDFAGSVLPELDAVAGSNPVLVAANKVDLLPKTLGRVRVESWVRRELEHLGVESLANIGGAVRLVSCRTGDGVAGLLDRARGLAEEIGGDVYVVGAANAGKSTLINYVLEKGKGKEKGEGARGKKRPGNANARRGAVTTSPLPGTTLKFIKVEFGNGGEKETSLYDTPGLLIPGTLTQILTPEELKMTVPKKPIEPITFRVATGKSVLIGGLAEISVVGEDTKPFLLTFYISNDIKLHPTSTDRADAFRQTHAGTTMLSPPLPPGPERLNDIGPFEYHEFDVRGRGWKEAGADVALRGLGWVAVTGSGTARIRVGVPKGVGVSVRPPLMPFDMWESASKYTGGKATRRAGKSRFGKKRSGVGRR